MPEYFDEVTVTPISFFSSSGAHQGSLVEVMRGRVGATLGSESDSIKISYENADTIGLYGIWWTDEQHKIVATDTNFDVIIDGANLGGSKSADEHPTGNKPKKKEIFLSSDQEKKIKKIKRYFFTNYPLASSTDLHIIFDATSPVYLRDNPPPFGNYKMVVNQNGQTEITLYNGTYTQSVEGATNRHSYKLIFELETSVNQKPYMRIKQWYWTREQWVKISPFEDEVRIFNRTGEVYDEANAQRPTPGITISDPNIPDPPERKKK